MNYKETTEYLFRSTPVFEHVGASAYKEGLYNTHALDDHFGHPHRRFRTIHVAGTNGKGSCSHTLAATLQAEGYRVGLYTSPHLVDFRERIRVNGVPVSEQYVVDFVARERAFFEPLHPSFFELTTAMAFKYFAEQEVDIAVIEVGLGGRLDCTNIIQPLLSIITNISLDHTQFLGDTLAKIAAEKAGIIKSHTPVVIGEDVPETRPVFIAKAQEMEAPIIFAQDEPQVVSGELSFGNDTTVGLSDEELPNGHRLYHTRDFGTIEGELAGAYQAKNANTVLTACKLLMEKGVLKSNLFPSFSKEGVRGGLSLEEYTLNQSINRGFLNVCETTGLLGRWQTLSEHPKAVCDTGHNVGGWQWLAPQIMRQPCQTLRIVFGMVDDKDIDTVMMMLPKRAVYYWTQASTHRAIPVERVMEKAKEHGLKGLPYPTVAQAYETAQKDAHEDDFIFVGGSSYVVADLLSAIGTFK